MPKIEKRIKRTAVAVSVLVAITIIVFGYFTIGFTAGLDDFMFFAFLAVVSPIALLNYIDYRWRKSVDEHLPDLFRSIVQAQETGIILSTALEEAAKRDYGPLTAELRKMTAQISWGASFEEALLSFAQRVGTVLSLRTVPMIIEASRSGGKVEKVFDPMGKFIQSTLMLEKERKTQTRPYIAIIYVALFVFLFTIVILFKTFFTNVEGVALFTMPTTSLMDLKRIFLHLTLIQGFFGGLVAGKMGEGSISAGLKHSIVMMLLGYVALRFFL
ncbi:type II secretion system F family protein [Candidatus Bathyarchaeota archaeon A05DMB-2]|jgi:flagellar protein FlaJ|nr:type II secretion system F family protein [Candidatus Bathyarchaeota archaeon A05DMB-2]